MTNDITGWDVFWFLVIFAFSALGLHFGLLWGWPLALGVAFVAALFGVAIIVIVFDGDGDIW
jgi:hypothetical protein